MVINIVIINIMVKINMVINMVITWRRQSKAHPTKSDLSGSSAVRLGLEIKWLVQYSLQMAFNFCMRGYHDVYSAQ